MADPRFYPEAQPISIADIAELARGEKARGCSSLMARFIGAPDAMAEGGLCFIATKDAAETVPDQKGVICLVAPELADKLPSSVAIVVTPDPKRAFGLVMRKMYPEPAPIQSQQISPLAHIADDAVIADDVRVDGGAFIDARAELGKGVWIKSGVKIGAGCVIGDGTVIDSNASIDYAIIGQSCQIGAGVVIGGCGFGVGRDGGNILLPHLGKVIIGNRTTIGGNSCIDRGFIDDTVIGDHVMIDNLVHIAHNAKIGNGNVICGQVGIAGSTVIGDQNIFGAQAGVADHVTIGSGNVFAARAGVTKSVGDGQVMAGFPAVPAQEFRREVATLRRLAMPRKK